MECPIEKRAGVLALPLKHFLLAAAGLLGFSAALWWGRGRLMGFELDARYVLGTAHLLTLGCLAATILGVMTQMIPAHGGTALRLPWAPRAGFWLLSLGLPSFVAALWSGSDAYWIPACAVAGAAALYLASLVPTWAAASKDVTARHFGGSLASLALLGALGAALAYDRQRGVIFAHGDGALIAHVHLALVGFVGLAIVGGSYRLFFPVAASRAASKRLSRAAAALLAAGLAGLAVDALAFGLLRARLWASLLAAGFAAYALQLEGFRRTEAELDLPSVYALLGISGGALWTALGLGLAFGWIEDRWESRAAYALAALLGWALPWALGQTYKIMTFLVWRSTLRLGTEPASYDDMLERRLAWVPFAALAAGVPLLVAGLLRESQPLVSAGAWSVLAAGAAHAAQTAYVLSRVFRAGRPA